MQRTIMSADKLNSIVSGNVSTTNDDGLYVGTLIHIDAPYNYTLQILQLKTDDDELDLSYSILELDVGHINTHWQKGFYSGEQVIADIAKDYPIKEIVLKPGKERILLEFEDGTLKRVIGDRELHATHIDYYPKGDEPEDLMDIDGENVFVIQDQYIPTEKDSAWIDKQLSEIERFNREGSRMEEDTHGGI